MLKAVNSQHRMLVVRHGDQNRIHQAAGDQVAALVENRNLVAQVFARPVAAIRTAIRHGDDLDLRQQSLQIVADVTRTHVARANDAQTYFFHVLCPPEIGFSRNVPTYIIA